MLTEDFAWAFLDQSGGASLKLLLSLSGLPSKLRPLRDCYFFIKNALFFDLKASSSEILKLKFLWQCDVHMNKNQSILEIQNLSNPEILKQT